MKFLKSILTVMVVSYYVSSQAMTRPSDIKKLYEDVLSTSIASNNIQELQHLLKEALKKGFDINTQDAQGNTLLHKAAAQGNLDAVKVLLRQDGINVNIKNQQGRTPLYEASVAKNPNLAVVEELINRGSDVNTIDAQEQPLLHTVAKGFNIPLMQKILAAPNINAFITDPAGKTAYEAIRRRITLASGDPEFTQERESMMKQLLKNTCSTFQDQCLRYVAEHAEEFESKDLQALPQDIKYRLIKEYPEQFE